MKKRNMTALFLALLLCLSACATSGEADLSGGSGGQSANSPAVASPEGTDSSRPPLVKRLDLPASTVAPALNREANAGTAQFGVDLLRQLRESGSGILISPLSAVFALSMTANGAAGETLSAFETVLGADTEVLNANAAQLMADYAALGGSTKAAVANSLWVDTNTIIFDQFLADCAGFRPGLFTADLDSNETRQAVNNWVSGETGGMVKELIRENLSPDTAVLLINAVYLDMTWEKGFDEGRTYEGAFYPAEGGQTEVSYMRRTGNLPYFTMDGGAGVVLPFDDGRLAFAAILPDGTLDSFLEDLDGAALSAGIAGASSRTRVSLTMPKFTARWDGSLAETLKALGLSAAFDGADFSRLGEAEGKRLCVTDVLHSAMLEVDEEGTKAAAATAVVMEPSSALTIDNGITLTLDRPFLYAIWDTQANIPLFLGTFEG